MIYKWKFVFILVHNELNLVIGDTESCDYSKNYCNRPLEPDRDYYLIVRAYTNDFYKNSPAIHFRTSNNYNKWYVINIASKLLIIF